MPYYIRVLAESDRVIPIAELQDALRRDSINVQIQVEDGTEQVWNQIVLSHKDESEIAIIERNPVINGELGAEELAEFIEAAKGLKPATAAQWLANYLPTVKSIYAFQLLDGTDVDPGWNGVHAVQSYLWSKLGGILHADGEGFSNRDGYHIVWQFSDRAAGPWSMAVLAENGDWVRFRMNLEDRRHREAFLAGHVPPGVARL